MSISSPDVEQVISFQGKMIQVPEMPVIPFIQGDGVGPEVWMATRQIVDAAVELAYLGKRAITWKELFAGERAYKSSQEWLPDETIQSLKTYHVAIKGPLNTPVGEGIRSIKCHIAQGIGSVRQFSPDKIFHRSTLSSPQT